MEFRLYDEQYTLLTDEFANKEELFAAANEEFVCFLFEQTDDDICQIIGIDPDFFEETQAAYTAVEGITEFQFVQN